MQFAEAISMNQGAFGLRIEDTAIKKLADYYDLVQENNPILHLVAPAPVEEFAVRHILESLTLLEYLPESCAFADVGTGAGLPSIPCLIVRPDLKSVLIEAKLKKSGFLRNAVAALGIEDRTRVINRQFEEISAPDVDFVTCRALDKFSQKLPRLIHWARGRPLRLFGGPNIEAELVKNGVRFTSKLMPGSEQRFLFVCESTAAPQRIVRTR